MSLKSKNGSSDIAMAGLMFFSLFLFMSMSLIVISNGKVRYENISGYESVKIFSEDPDIFITEQFSYEKSGEGFKVKFTQDEEEKVITTENFKDGAKYIFVNLKEDTLYDYEDLYPFKLIKKEVSSESNVYLFQSLKFEKVFAEVISQKEIAPDTVVSFVSVIEER